MIGSSNIDWSISAVLWKSTRSSGAASTTDRERALNPNSKRKPIVVNEDSRARWHRSRACREAEVEWFGWRWSMLDVVVSIDTGVCFQEVGRANLDSEHTTPERMLDGVGRVTGLLVFYSCTVDVSLYQWPSRVQAIRARLGRVLALQPGDTSSCAQQTVTLRKSHSRPVRSAFGKDMFVFILLLLQQHDLRDQ